MDKAQRDEFGKPMGFLLNAANKVEMVYNVLRRLDMPVHDSRGRRYTKRMGAGDNVDPGSDIYLLMAEDFPHAVVQNLGRGTGNRSETMIAQHPDILGILHSHALGAVHDLHG